MTNKVEYDEIILEEEVGFLPSGTYNLGADVPPEKITGLWYRMNRRANMPIAEYFDEVKEIPFAAPNRYAMISAGKGLFTVSGLDGKKIVYGPSIDMESQQTQTFRVQNVKGYFDYASLKLLPKGKYQVDTHHYKSLLAAPVSVSCDQNLVNQFSEAKKAFVPVFAPITFPDDLKQNDSVYILAYGLDRKLVVLQFTLISKKKK